MLPQQGAIRAKIQLGDSKSGPCRACVLNQKKGTTAPPLHPNCKCKIHQTLK